MRGKDESKHTPGPWMAKRAHDVTDATLVYAADGKAAVARLVNHPHEYNVPYPQEVAANASLVAAAPELLAALKRLRERVIVGGAGRDGAHPSDH